MQDITEQQDVAREIGEAISRPFGDAFDEVDIFPTSSIKINSYSRSLCAFFSPSSPCHLLLAQRRIGNTLLSLVLFALLLRGRRASYRCNPAYLVCSVRMSCWQSWRSWNRRTWRTTWRVWLDSPVCPAPNCPQHGPVGAQVSATPPGADESLQPLATAAVGFITSAKYYRAKFLDYFIYF